MVNFLLFALWLSLHGKVLQGFQPFALGAVAMVIACLVFGHLELRKADAAAAVESLPIKVAAIQPNVPQEQKWDPAFRDEIASRLQRLTLEAAKAKPLLIVWPETSVPGEVRNDAPMTRFAQDLAKQTGCNLLIGSQDSSLDAKPGAVRKYYNAAVLVDAKGEMTQVYRKMHLVPFGEFLPFAKWFPFLRWFIPIPEDFSAGTEATVFQMPGNVFRWMDLDGTRRHVMDMRRFGVAICFEDTFSEPFRRLCYQKLAFMVNMTNDAWFQHSGIALQHANLAVFRAIENREPLLRSTNTGYTCLIDPYGRIQAQVKKDASIFVPGMLVAEIVPNFVKTIYSQMGDFVAQACLILALMKVFIWRRERRNK